MKILDSRKAILTAITATGGPWNGAIIGLYKNNIVPTPRTTLAELDEADFTGYTRSAAITWSAVGQNIEDQAICLSDQKVFAGTGSAVANLIYGYMVLTTGGTFLLEVVPLPEPVSINEAGDLLPIVHVLTEPQE